MQTNLFIPTKIRVGFQERAGTFTGKLAYIIYYDEKGKIRKETSWEQWRDKKIDFIEFENKPRNNYVLNKGIERHGDWGSGRSVVRVYDPRDFEFEISVDNLIGILMHSDVSKRDIVEECVFAWAGTELVLLPANSEEYQTSVKYTEKQSMKISAKTLIKGAVYGKKKSDEELVYLGFFSYYDASGYSYLAKQKHKGNRHVFVDRKAMKDNYSWRPAFIIPGVETLATIVSDEPVADYAELVEKFHNSKYSKLATKVVTVAEPLKKTKDNSTNYFFKMINDALICQIYFNVSYHTKTISINSIYIGHFNINFKDGISFDEINLHQNQHWYHRQNSRYSDMNEYLEITEKCTEKGFDKLNLTHSQFSEIMLELGFGNIYYYNKDNEIASADGDMTLDFKPVTIAAHNLNAIIGEAHEQQN